MTPLNLIEVLAEDIQKEVANYKFIAQYQEDKFVRVYAQDIPTAEFKSDTYYPFVLIQLLNVEDDVTDSVASVLFTIGTYNGEERRDGWRDHLNLCETIRQYILKNEVVGKLYVLQLPLFWGEVEKQSEDFSYANFFVQYRVPRPSTNYCQ